MTSCLSFFLVLSLAITRLAAQENVADQLTRERQEQTGTAITIIFDDSGSMNADQKLAQAKSAFVSWLNNVPEDYKLSLITFKQNGKILIPLGENNRAKLANVVKNISADAGTPICAALRLAAQQIDARRKNVTPYERHVVLLFTDGEENQDPGGINAVRKNIQLLREANIEVAGVGFHGQGDYMEGVATRYYSASDAASLASGLSKIDAEIGDTSDIVVSSEELQALKKSVTPASSPRWRENAAESAATPSSPAPAKRKFSPGNFFFIIIAFLVLRFLFRKRK